MFGAVCGAIVYHWIKVRTCAKCDAAALCTRNRISVALTVAESARICDRCRRAYDVHLRGDAWARDLPAGRSGIRGGIAALAADAVRYVFERAPHPRKWMGERGVFSPIVYDAGTHVFGDARCRLH